MSKKSIIIIIIGIIIIITPSEFFTPALSDGFLWRLSDSKSPQVSRTLLSILADLSNAIVWMFSAHSLISSSSRPLTKPLGTDPSAPITIGITITFMFCTFFSSLERFKYLSLVFFDFHSVVCWDGKVHNLAGFFFLLIITKLGWMAGII